MAQALLIKTADTAFKTVGDIVGVYEDAHKFSEKELLVFNVAKIEGTREEVVEKLSAINIPINTAYKTSTSLWTRTRPEEKAVWKDTDERWYFLEERPQYRWSMALLDEAEKLTLETATTGLARDTAYQKMVVNPGSWDEKNKTEAVDLNT